MLERGLKFDKLIAKCTRVRQKQQVMKKKKAAKGKMVNKYEVGEPARHFSDAFWGMHVRNKDQMVEIASLLRSIESFEPLVYHTFKK